MTDFLVFVGILALLCGAIGIAGRYGAKGCALLVAGIFALVASVVWWQRGAEERLTETARAFAGSIRDFEARLPPDAEAPEGVACVRGMLLLVAGDTPHALQLRLPDRLRARRPSDVETFGRLQCEERVVGTYRRAFQTARGRNAIQHVCELDLVDLHTRRRVARSEFIGTEPPSSPGFLDVTQGSFPSDEIVEFLERLPACAGGAETTDATAPGGVEPAGARAPRVTDLTIRESGPAGQHKWAHFEVAAGDGDLDLLAEQRVFYRIECAGVFSTASTSAEVWERDSGRARVRIDAPSLGAAGSCRFLLSVRDEDGNESEPVETTVEFRGPAAPASR